MTRSIAILLAVPLVWLVVGSVEAQRGASPTSAAGPAVRVQGRVLEADTSSTPVPRARITVTPRGGTPSVPVFADGSGRFEISVPSSAPYTVSLAKAGFVPQTFARTATESAATTELRLVRAGVIAGQVMDSSGRPVVGGGVRARRLESPAGMTPQVSYAETDDLGAYRLSGLPPGSYTLETVRATIARPLTPAMLADSTLLARQADEQRAQVSKRAPLSEAVTVDVRGGEEQTAWLISSAPGTDLPYAAAGGTVSGTVRDAFGEPLQGLDVQLWSVRVANGRFTVLRALSRTTDDRGRYRIFHVPTGTYLVAAADDLRQAGTWPGTSFLPVYYPGRHAIDEAIPLQVGARQELPGVDILFSERTGARVAGVVTNAAGQPVAARVSLTVSHRSGSIAAPVRETRANPRGEFEFLHVPPGDYVVRASPISVIIATNASAIAIAPSTGTRSPERSTGTATVTLRNDAREFAMQYVTVDTGDPAPLFLQAIPTATARGRMVFESGPPPALSSLRVGAVAVDPDLTPSPGTVSLTTTLIERDGTFTIPGLLGPMRLALVRAPPGWWLRTTTIGRANVTDEAIDFGRSPGLPDEITLVLANTAASLQGRTLNERGGPAGDCWVIAFSTDSKRWYVGSPYLRNARVGADGRFMLESLPPGDYRVAAIRSIEDDAPSGEWQASEFLSRLMPSARQVSLGERDRVTTDVQLTQMPRF